MGKRRGRNTEDPGLCRICTTIESEVQASTSAYACACLRRGMDACVGVYAGEGETGRTRCTVHLRWAWKEERNTESMVYGTARYRPSVRESGWGPVGTTLSERGRRRREATGLAIGVEKKPGLVGPSLGRKAREQPWATMRPSALWYGSSGDQLCACVDFAV